MSGCLHPLCVYRSHGVVANPYSSPLSFPLLSFRFSVPIEGCGTTGQLEAATRTQDMYFENTIIIQTDPIIQEEWDVARNIRCTWPHTFSKSVVATPFKVYEPKKVGVLWVN